jgi:hypothetical protein
MRKKERGCASALTAQNMTATLTAEPRENRVQRQTTGDKPERTQKRRAALEALGGNPWTKALPQW